MTTTTSSLEAVLPTAFAGMQGVVSAYLFGSVAEGRAHHESDVDLGVLLSYGDYPRADTRFEARLVLISRLTSALGRDADVVILNDAPPQLARHIMTNGQRVFLADAAADHACLRTVLSRAADIEPFLRRTRQVKLASLAR